MEKIDFLPRTYLTSHLQRQVRRDDLRNIRTPRDAPSAILHDILIQNRHARRQSHRDEPPRILALIITRAQRHRVREIPVSELGDRAREEDRLAERCSFCNVESDGHGGDGGAGGRGGGCGRGAVSAWGRGGGAGGQDGVSARFAPRGGHLAGAAGGGGEEGGVGPCQVGCGQRGAGGAGELLREAAVGWGVCGDDGEVAVGVGFDGCC